MNVMIIGSSGYVGNNLMTTLLDTGHAVKPFDIVLGKNILDRGQVKFAINGLPMKDIRPEVIINLSAVMGVANVDKKIKEATAINIIGLLNVLDVVVEARDQDPAYDPHIILISNLAAANPTNIYACHKRLVEEIGKVYVRDHGLKITILRFSNIYGGENYVATKESVISKFIRALKDHKPVTIAGNGSAVRDFVHIDDVIRGILCAMDDSKGKGNIYEICSGVGTSIQSLAELIGVEYKKVLGDSMGVDTNIGDWSKAKDEIGYSPNTDLKKGIEELKAQLTDEKAPATPEDKV